MPENYVATLCKEIEAFRGPKDITSIFIGGGTPSLLSVPELEKLMTALRDRFHWHTPEITAEMNPDDATPALLDVWKALGINRVSLGVQSFDDTVLRYLGRRHDAAAAEQACGWVAERFDTWSLDLIFGAPPVEAYTKTLEVCRMIAPPHVAAYGLTYEDGTPFAEKRGDAVSEEVSLELYRQTEEALAAYKHYEISNFAKPEHESRHNLIYWHNEEYAGFGAGAYSFIGKTRARNASDIQNYLALPHVKMELISLSDAEIRLEAVIQHLRLKEGLCSMYYLQRFGRSLKDDFGEALDKMITRGLLLEDNSTIRPTPEGFYLNNEIGLALVD